jgi:hypothetical protein
MIAREEFLRWQCRIRQIAMRDDGGRPSRGMQACVWLGGGIELIEAMNMLLVPGEPSESTAFFRFQVKKIERSQTGAGKGSAILAINLLSPRAFVSRRDDSLVCARFKCRRKAA